MKTILLACAALALCWGPAQAVDKPVPGERPCTSPESGQFDFWVGEWDVYAGGNMVGHNKITMILDGCVLLEEYQAAGSDYQGKSFNFFDPGDGLWHQIWVDNQGLRLNLKGWLTGLGMTLSGDRMVGNGPVADRITWTENDDGTVRQLWEQTADGGMTWQVLFEGHYRPAAGR